VRIATAPEIAAPTAPTTTPVTPTMTTMIPEGNAYDNFINTIKSDFTKRGYIFSIKKYMAYLNISHINDLLTSFFSDPLTIQKKIIEYIVHLKNDKKLSAITINQYVAAVIHFYLVNDIITLNRKKIGMYFPEYIRKQEDSLILHILHINLVDTVSDIGFMILFLFFVML
jgi:hypothetical protein